MANKSYRDAAEMKSLFNDPKFFRQALKSLGQAIALQPAVRPLTTVDKDGMETTNSLIERYSYEKLSSDIASLARSKREPTELEMILHCQMVKARTDTSAAVFIRDTLGAKPVDESKQDLSVSNPYEQLTDEELELIQAERERKALAAQESSASSSLASPDDTSDSDNTNKEDNLCTNN